MRTQFNEAGEMKIGDKGNGHRADIHNIHYLADYISGLVREMAHMADALPGNAKGSDGSTAVFLRSSWITSGVFALTAPGDRPAAA
jgi:hypothetical protein